MAAARRAALIPGVRISLVTRRTSACIAAGGSTAADAAWDNVSYAGTGKGDAGGVAGPATAAAIGMGGGGGVNDGGTDGGVVGTSTSRSSRGVRARRGEAARLRVGVARVSTAIAFASPASSSAPR
jgi:hypothetical protein